MSLNLANLTAAIETAMLNQLEKLKPDEPLAPESKEFAADLALAIHQYVAEARVVEVEVQVGDLKYGQVGTGALE